MTTEQERQYEICRERGHEASGEYQTVGFVDTWSICRWCGTHFRFGEPELIEREEQPAAWTVPRLSVPGLVDLYAASPTVRTPPSITCTVCDSEIKTGEPGVFIHERCAP